MLSAALLRLQEAGADAVASEIAGGEPRDWAARVLVRTLVHGRRAVRRIAFDTLRQGNIDPAPALDVLYAGLAHRVRDVRARVAKTLLDSCAWKRRLPSDLSRLEALAEDRDRSARRFAFLAFGAWLARGIRILHRAVERAPSTWAATVALDEAAGALADAAPAILAAARSSHPRSRLFAAHALAALDRASHGAWLGMLRLAGDAERQVAGAAAFEITQSPRRPDPWFAALRGLLDAKEPHVRGNALWIGRRAAPEAARSLAFAALEEPDPDVRRSALGLLGRMRPLDAESRRTLQRTLKRGAASDAAAAACALAEAEGARDPEVRRRMRRALRSRSWDIRFLALRTVADLGPAGRFAVQELIRLARSGREPAADEAIASLGAIGPAAAKAAPALCEVLERAPGRRSWRRGWTEAASALGKIGVATPRVIAALRSRLPPEAQDGDALDAARALWNLRVEDGRIAAALASGLRSDIENVRAWQARFLGASGARAARFRPAFQALKSDLCPRVREAARAALRATGRAAPRPPRGEGSKRRRSSRLSPGRQAPA